MFYYLKTPEVFYVELYGDKFYFFNNLGIVIRRFYIEFH